MDNNTLVLMILFRLPNCRKQKTSVLFLLCSLNLEAYPSVNCKKWEQFLLVLFVQFTSVRQTEVYFSSYFTMHLQNLNERKVWFGLVYKSSTCKLHKLKYLINKG